MQRRERNRGSGTSEREECARGQEPWIDRPSRTLPRDSSVPRGSTRASCTRPRAQQVKPCRHPLASSLAPPKCPINAAEIAHEELPVRGEYFLGAGPKAGTFTLWAGGCAPFPRWVQVPDKYLLFNGSKL